MPGGEVIELLLSWFVTTTLTFGVVIADERRMSAERLARAWPPSSRDAAIIAFGVLALPVHFARTRGRWGSVRGVLGYPLGLFLGLLAMVVVAVASGLLVSGIGWIFGLSVEP